MSKLIVSVDGGGIRGAAVTQFLDRLEVELRQRGGGSLREHVDFYAGTSTGSIITLALATTELPMSRIISLYNYETAHRIFTENRGWFEIDGINAPKYEADGKTEVLAENLGDSTVGSVPNGKHVLVVTYGIERRKPEVIKSTDAKYHHLKSYEVADASSAAPTYFPTKELEIEHDEEFWLVDGGVTANNPTMCAIAEAKQVWPDESTESLRVLSIGTGYRTRKINGPASRRWGAIQWFTKGHILDVLTDERVVAYQAATITGSGRYIRVNADMKAQPGLPNPPDDALDDVSRTNIRRLKAMGNFWFDRYGEAATKLVLDQYDGPSLDRIDAGTGEPKPLP